MARVSNGLNRSSWDYVRLINLVNTGRVVVANRKSQQTLGQEARVGKNNWSTVRKISRFQKRRASIWK